MSPRNGTRSGEDTSKSKKLQESPSFFGSFPSLLLRLPAVGVQGSRDLLDPPPEVSPGAKDIAFSQLVRNRLCELEAGGLNSALHRYMQEANDLEDRDSRRAALTAAALPHTAVGR